MLAGERARDAQSHFDIHQDASPLQDRQYPVILSSPERPAGTQPLADLPTDGQVLAQRRPLGPRPLPALPELKQANRQRRPQIGTQTFRPLNNSADGDYQQTSGKATHETVTLDFATACSALAPRGMLSIDVA